MTDDLGVESVTGESDAAVSKQVLRSSTPLANAWTGAQQREVAGSTAEVANEDQFIMVERGFIVVGGGHGLHFEIHRFVAGFLESFPQTRQSVNVIGFRFGAHETH